MKPLHRFGVQVRTDQFFNIYRLKKKGGFLRKPLFLQKFPILAQYFEQIENFKLNENNYSLIAFCFRGFM